MTFSEFKALNPDIEPRILIYGRIFDLNKLRSLSTSSKAINILSFYVGKDASELFPFDTFNNAMRGIGSIVIQSSVSTEIKPASLTNLGIIPFSDLDINLSRQPFQIDSPEFMGLLEGLHNSWVADLGWDDNDLVYYGSSTSSPIIAIKNILFNVSVLLQKKDYNLDPVLLALASLPWSGYDHSSQLEQVLSGRGDIQPNSEDSLLSYVAERVPIVGIIDPRSTFNCSLGRNVLIWSSALVLSITLIKFLAALQLGQKKNPEILGRYTILQITCFTEGECSLRKSIHSLISTDYSNQFKLLWIICDGLATGVGNLRPTAMILFEILGIPHDPAVENFSDWIRNYGGFSYEYDSLGDPNFAKAWCGYYYDVPFLLIVKIGSKEECHISPGNRGKRDSQLILLRWLSKLLHLENQHLLERKFEDGSKDSQYIPIPVPTLSPLEKELTNIMKLGLGIDPLLYEYLLMVDADTQCASDALTRMISSMVSDKNIIGLCGETTLANPRATWVTSIQIYEYYISHHLSKAFESLFGIVTCLPGCFSIYRLRTTAADNIYGTMKPLLLSPILLSAYGVQDDNDESTLHKKNLLILGEDRFLTTLLLKYFPGYKTSFSEDAICKTYAPETWRILVSQRRRWINSTVHNLWELLAIPRLCGIGCISMKVVVLLDLYSTLVMPATLLYLFWAIISLILDDISPSHSSPSSSSLIGAYSVVLLLVVNFTFQAIICILKRRWYNLGWMFLYILTFPIFVFVLPLYAFWHFDDFTWGKTRKQKTRYQKGPLPQSNPWGSLSNNHLLFGRRYSSSVLDTGHLARHPPTDGKLRYAISMNPLEKARLSLPTTSRKAKLVINEPFSKIGEEVILEANNDDNDSDDASTRSTPLSSTSSSMVEISVNPTEVPLNSSQITKIEAYIKRLILDKKFDHIPLSELRLLVEKEFFVNLGSCKKWFSELVKSILMESIEFEHQPV